MRDLQLIVPLATMPFVLMARSDIAADTPQALIKWLKPRPGEVNYGSSGDGSTGHLAGELFRRMARVSMVHVSYNGGVAALSGLRRARSPWYLPRSPWRSPSFPVSFIGRLR